MSYNKPKKRSTMARLQSVLDGDSSYFSSQIENELVSSTTAPVYKARLRDLFVKIEKEFDQLYAENVSLQEKLEILNEKIDRESCVSEKMDSIDVVSDLMSTKILSSAKKPTGSSQKLKTAYKLKAQTSKIVSSFKGPNTHCTMVRDYSGHKDGVWEVSVSKSGQPVIGTASADQTACIWSIETGRCLLQYTGHSGSVNSIRFHPSKDIVLTASGDNSAHLWQAVVNWDLTTKGQSSEEELDYNDDTPTAFERIENLDRTDSITNKIEVLRTPICEFGGHSGALAAADFLAGGDQVITASWDRLAMLHDVESGLSLHTLGGHDSELTNVTTHHTQRLAVSCSRDTTFRLWDFREPAHSVSVFQGHTESVTSAVFAHDDKIISSSDDRSVKVWDLRNMRSPVATIRTDSPINRIAVTETGSSGGIIAIPHDNRQIRLFDLQTGQRLARLPRTSRQGHRRMVSSVAWADGRTTNLFTSGFDRRVLGWAIHPFKEL